MSGPYENDPEDEMEEDDFDTDYCEFCGLPYEECECEAVDEWVDDELPPQWEGGE